ncbi:unnamed protein product [Strongylus vulgaris]|uniref:Uncharacterized protein n=1 Tax=Strongylus vulgaris TaxID=40348 RepID=A0A3P7IWA0_STRVU|nr:unnamed protein product [Strongylus vulgaris]
MLKIKLEYVKKNFALRSILDTKPDAEVVTAVTPMLSGDVVVKRIHERNDAARSQEHEVPLTSDHGDEEYAERDEEEDQVVSVQPVQPKEASAEVGNTTIIPYLGIDWSDRETIILIYSLLFGFAIFFLMCLLICYVWCRKRRQSHDFKTNY